MDLLECDAKPVLARHGVKVPASAIWPELPDSRGSLVVKAQIPAGRRGSHGGIRFAENREEAEAHATAMLGTTIAGHSVDTVSIEAKLMIERELYVAVLVDRDTGGHVVLASPDGGSDIESVPDARIRKMHLDPLLGLRPFHTRHLARFLALEPELVGALDETLSALYRIATNEDATLVEINPLAVVPGEGLVAADAKISLDDSARFRWKVEPRLTPATAPATSRSRVGDAGASWVEMDPHGDLVALVSGAGLLMATVDLLIDGGVAVRAGVDLKWTVLGNDEALEEIVRVTAEAGPRTVFVNAFLQVGSCERFAEGLRAIQRKVSLEGRLVARLKGRDAEAGRAILASAGFEVFEELESAITALASA